MIYIIIFSLNDIKIFKIKSISDDVKNEPKINFFGNSEDDYKNINNIV